MTKTASLDTAVAAYVAFYEALSPESLDRLDTLCTTDVRFRDPFNDVRGVASYRAILARMFEDVSAPRFQVRDWARTNQIAYLRWDFTFRSRNGTSWHIEGVSEVHFDEEGLVAAHLDHWDSGVQFFGRLPLLGSLIRLVRKRLALRT